MKRVIFEKWQIKKLLIWFLGFVILGGGYICYTTYTLYSDKSGEEYYWQKNLINDGAHGLTAGVLSYMAASIVDKAIMVAAVFLIIKFIPQKAADFFCISKKIPIAVFAKTKADVEFQAEADKLRSSAQAKIDNQKSAGAVK